MEFIGVFVMMIALMGVASVAGVLCALVTYFIVRSFKRSSLRATLIAGFFPPAVMAYLLICLIASSVLSSVVGTPDLVFGDIHEALPNGFTLDALDKMPECGHIQKAGNDSIQVAWVGSVQVAGPYVLGKYDYTYFPRTAKETGRDFFLFDTRNDALQNFANESELAAAAKTEIHLTQTPNFRGVQSSLQRISNALLLLITLLPPLGLAAFFIWKFRLFLRSSQAITSGLSPIAERLPSGSDR